MASHNRMVLATIIPSEGLSRAAGVDGENTPVLAGEQHEEKNRTYTHAGKLVGEDSDRHGPELGPWLASLNVSAGAFGGHG
jgi:hypothetical protein